MEKASVSQGRRLGTSEGAMDNGLSIALMALNGRISSELGQSLEFLTKYSETNITVNQKSTTVTFSEPTSDFRLPNPS